MSLDVRDQNFYSNLKYNQKHSFAKIWTRQKDSSLFGNTRWANLDWSLCTVELKRPRATFLYVSLAYLFRYPTAVRPNPSIEANTQCVKPAVHLPSTYDGIQRWNKCSTIRFMNHSYSFPGVNRIWLRVTVIHESSFWAHIPYLNSVAAGGYVHRPFYLLRVHPYAGGMGQTSSTDTAAA